MRLEI
jgi:hypothetical protein